MNILMIHPHDITSPAEPWTVRVVNVAAALTRLGHAIRLVYFKHPTISGATDVSMPYETVALPRRGISFVSNIARILRISRASDLIHVQKSAAYAALPALYAHYINALPLHYDWDDYESAIYETASPPRIAQCFMAHFERRMLSHVDTVSVASSSLRAMARTWGFPTERIFDVPVGVDSEHFKPGLDTRALRKHYGITKPVIMYIGQLGSAQYVRMLIDAATNILAHVQVHIMIVGAGEAEAQLRVYAQKNGIAKDIIFTGAVSHRDIPRYLNMCDIAVACFEDNNATRAKSSLKVVEYMACARAIVASDIAEVRTMLGDAGILTEPGDSHALASAIITLLHDRERRDALGAAARTRAVQLYAWDSSAERLIWAYEKAISLCARSIRQ